MRLEWIEDILAVLDTGSLARAAEKRLLTQSAFTRRVRLIEDSIGAELFDRRRKPVTLMPGVEALAPELRELSMRLRKIRHKLKTATNQDGGTLSFACQHAITTTVSPWIVRALTAKNDVSIRVRSNNQEECLRLLLSGEVDFVLMYTLPEEAAPFFEHAFEALTLGLDTLIPVCAPSLEDIGHADQIPTINYPTDVFLGRVFVRNIAPRLNDNVTLLNKAETALTLAAYEYAIGGIGVAWLPQSMVVEAIEEGLLVSLEAQLPVQPLDIKAFRLSKDRAGADDPVWQKSLAEVELPIHLKRHESMMPEHVSRLS